VQKIWMLHLHGDRSPESVGRSPATWNDCMWLLPTDRVAAQDL